MNKFRQILGWLRIEEDGVLSLTNLILFILAAKIAFVKPGPFDLGGFTLAILNYGHKRIKRAEQGQQDDSDPGQGVDSLKPEIEALKSNVNVLGDELGKVRMSIGLNRTFNMERK